MIILPILTASRVNFTLKVWENILFEHGRKGSSAKQHTEFAVEEILIYRTGTFALSNFSPFIVGEL